MGVAVLIIVTSVMNGFERELRERMLSLGLLEKDIQEQFVSGSGRGGQKVNKTSQRILEKVLKKAADVRTCHQNSGYAKVSCRLLRIRTRVLKLAACTYRS